MDAQERMISEMDVGVVEDISSCSLPASPTSGGGRFSRGIS